MKWPYSYIPAAHMRQTVVVLVVCKNYGIMNIRQWPEIIVVINIIKHTDN